MPSKDGDNPASGTPAPGTPTPGTPTPGTPTPGTPTADSDPPDKEEGVPPTAGAEGRKEDLDEPELTAPKRNSVRLEPPEAPGVDLDGPEVDLDIPAPEELELKEPEIPKPAVPVNERVELEELLLVRAEDAPEEQEVLTPEVSAPLSEQVTLSAATTSIGFVSETRESQPELPMKLMKPAVPFAEFRTSTPRSQSVKLVAPLAADDIAQLDLSAYDEDARLTDEQFVERLARGQLTLQREAEAWRKEYNCT